jgi:hypothetical protein
VREPAGISPKKLHMGKELAARLQSDEVAFRQSVPIVSASME